jgi:plasmid stabilization system protein ParE
MKPVRLAPEAAREVDEAAGWYESRQAGLAVRFLDELDQTLLQIRRHPSAFPCLEDVPADLEVRRALMSRFPYGLIFLELRKDIRVVAVAHAKRRPGYWIHRIKAGAR